MILTTVFESYAHFVSKQLMCNWTDCPVCGADPPEFVEGEQVDNGVGMQQCSPDFCYRCGYIQQNSYTGEGQSIEYFVSCWEKGIQPFSESFILTTTISKLLSE